MDDTLERVFADICDALGCEHDNEAALAAIARLRAEVEHAYERGVEDTERHWGVGRFS